MSVYVVESQSAVWLIFTSFPIDFVFIQDRNSSVCLVCWKGCFFLKFVLTSGINLCIIRQTKMSP